MSYQDDPTIPNRTFMERGYVVARYNDVSPPAELWKLHTSDGRVLHRRIEFAAPLGTHPRFPFGTQSHFGTHNPQMNPFASHNPFGTPNPFGSHHHSFGHHHLNHDEHRMRSMPDRAAF